MHGMGLVTFILILTLFIQLLIKDRNKGQVILMSAVLGVVNKGCLVVVVDYLQNVDYVSLKIIVLEKMLETDFIGI